MIMKIKKPRQKNMSLCIVNGCKGTYHAKGYCLQHYRQFLAGKPITLEIKTAKRYDKTNDFYCTIQGCWSKRKTRGLCHKHYQQWLRKQIGTKSCSIDGCNGRHIAKGFCLKHYDRHKYIQRKEREKEYANNKNTI